MKKTVITDIEGTTSAIAFVKDVLFPYARQRLPEFVRAHAKDPQVRRWLDQVREESHLPMSDAELSETLIDWVDADRKHTALKALQGILWQRGYVEGDYTAHVYADAAEALRRWHADGHPLYVYSSGSVPAQKLFFRHSAAGDLTSLFSGYFDTEIGGKREAQSYRNIVDVLALPAENVVFLSDVVEELDAARAAGLATVLVDRPEDYPAPRLGEATHGHPRVVSFAAICL